VLAADGAFLAEGSRGAVLAFLVKNGALSQELRSLMLAWRYSGLSARIEVRVAPEDAEGRKKPAGYMLRAPMLQIRRYRGQNTCMRDLCSVPIGSKPTQPLKERK